MTVRARPGGLWMAPDVARPCRDGDEADVVPLEAARPGLLFASERFDVTVLSGP